MPRTRVKNVARGGRGDVRVQVRGLRELEGKLKSLMPDNPQIARGVQLLVGDATDLIADKARSNAIAVHAPHDVLDDIFTYKKPKDTSRRQRVSALAGIRKRGSKRGAGWSASAYREWGKRAAKMVGESLATMWEIGTSKMPARPFFGPAVEETKSAIISKLSAGYKSLLDDVIK